MGNLFESGHGLHIDTALPLSVQEVISPDQEEEYTEETLVDSDAVSSILQGQVIYGFEFGFAFCTLLILFTYGVFKAFSLLNIKSGS